MKKIAKYLPLILSIAGCSHTNNQTSNATHSLLSGSAGQVQKAQTQMQGLAEYIQEQGGDIKRIFNEINQVSQPQDNSFMQNFAHTIMSDNGQLTCVQNYRIAADLDPRNLTKNVHHLQSVQPKNLVEQAIKSLRANPEQEIVTSYAQLPTNIPNPENNKKFLTQKHVMVIYGRKALLGDRLNKQQDSKFFCYIAYPSE